jgi:hypothetical protein
MHIQSLDPRNPSGPVPGKGRGEGEVREGGENKPKEDRALPDDVSQHGGPRTTGQALRKSLRSHAPKRKR